MCQRYVLPEQGAAEREFLPVTAWWVFAAKFNVAATQYVPAIRIHDGQSEGVMLRWGLIPAWLEGDPAGPPNANVRSNGIEDSQVYRNSLAQQSALHPADCRFLHLAVDAGEVSSAVFRAPDRSRGVWRGRDLGSLGQ